MFPSTGKTESRILATTTSVCWKSWSHFFQVFQLIFSFLQKLHFLFGDLWVTSTNGREKVFAHFGPFH